MRDLGQYSSNSDIGAFTSSGIATLLQICGRRNDSA